MEPFRTDESNKQILEISGSSFVQLDGEQKQRCRSNHDTIVAHCGIGRYGSDNGT